MKLKFAAATAALTLTLVACSSEVSTTYTLPEIADIIVEASPSYSMLLPLLPEDDYFKEYVETFYEIDYQELEDGYILTSPSGSIAYELALLVYEDEQSAVEASGIMLNYKDVRLANYTGYLPDQADIIEDGIVTVSGSYVALIISPEATAAQEAFELCFEEDAQIAEQRAEVEQEEMTEITGDYDHQAVLAAWQSGDTSALTPKNLAIFESASQVVANLIKPDMTDYEKEVALHDYILEQTDYDSEVNNQSRDAKPSPDNDNPYGVFAYGKSICSGYTTTFQLFMDMVGIECISVTGTAHRGAEEHAWNMVKLGGDWYCVDVTWNDTAAATPGFDLTRRYFNVTSDFMRKNDHQWEDEGIPEATAIRYAG